MLPGPTDQLKKDDVLKTYRYLRIGIVGAVVLLAVSIAIERSKVPCLQTSSEAVAEAIALHLNVRVPRSRGVEAHLLNAGTAFDVIRLRSRKIPQDLIREIESRWPRENGFCDDILATWKRESDDHRECRGAFLNTWGSFKHRILRTCPPD